MNMRERLAVAVSAGLEKSDAVGVIGGDGEGCILDGTFDLFDVVDSVLDALRDPTPEMIEAGLLRERMQVPLGGVYRAMLDAARAGR